MNTIDFESDLSNFENFKEILKENPLSYNYNAFSFPLKSEYILLKKNGVEIKATALLFELITRKKISSFIDLDKYENVSYSVFFPYNFRSLLKVYQKDKCFVSNSLSVIFYENTKVHISTHKINDTFLFSQNLSMLDFGGSYNDIILDKTVIKTKKPIAFSEKYQNIDTNILLLTHYFFNDKIDYCSNFNENNIKKGNYINFDLDSLFDEQEISSDIAKIIDCIFAFYGGSYEMASTQNSEQC